MVEKENNEKLLHAVRVQYLKALWNERFGDPYCDFEKISRLGKHFVDIVENFISERCLNIAEDGCPDLSIYIIDDYRSAKLSRCYAQGNSNKIFVGRIVPIDDDSGEYRFRNRGEHQAFMEDLMNKIDHDYTQMGFHVKVDKHKKIVTGIVGEVQTISISWDYDNEIRRYGGELITYAQIDAYEKGCSLEDIFV